MDGLEAAIRYLERSWVNQAVGGPDRWQGLNRSIRICGAACPNGSKPVFGWVADDLADPDAVKRKTRSASDGARAGSRKGLLLA